ncbi:MAG: hypothetical protein AAGG09_10670 [Pseudomonadota bacterium]
MKPLNVPADEHGAVRVFALAVSGAEWTDTSRPDWRLPDALGVESLGVEDVQVFDIGDLAGVPLRQFLADGYGIDEAALDAAGTALDAPSGVIAVIRSAAIPDKPVVLTPVPEATLLGRFEEPAAAIAFKDPKRYASAKPRPKPKASPPPDTPEPEDDGARLVETFAPSREAYIRSHLWLGAAAMGGATAVLYAIGNPDYWVGAIAGIGAIAVRGFYLASEELGQRWELTETSIRGRAAGGKLTRVVALNQVQTVRSLGSAVQVVTKSGDKMLMKYIGDPHAVRAQIARAAGVAL